MAITPANIQYFLSGGSGNSNAAASLGGVISSTQITSNASNNLWDDATAAESSTGDTEYRCYYVKNAHATLTLTSPNVVWIATQGTGGHTISIGLDAAAVGNGTSTGVAVTVANESTAPAGVTFASPTSKATSTINFPSLAPGQVKAIWVRRVVAAGSGAIALTPVYQVEGTTLP